MITKNTDFIGQFSIANATDIEPNSEGNSEEVDLFIEDFEPECLVTVLGYSLYEELKPELLKKPFVPGAPEEADQKWIDLVNGKANYQGLVKLLVPFIYFKFLDNDDSHNSGVGVIKETPKGATSFSARKKAITAWRAYYKWTVGADAPDTVTSRSSIKGPIVGIIYGDDDDKYWSLYNFLGKNFETYPNWSPSKISNITLYGI